MQRQRHAGFDEAMQRAGVPRRGIAGFGTGEIEADHAAVLERDREIGAPRDIGFVVMPHRADDQAARHPGRDGRSREARDQRRGRRLGGDAVRFEERRRDPELGQHAAVEMRVLRRLERDPFHRVGRGHRRDGQREAAQVLDQRPRVGPRAKPRAERRDVVRRRRDVAFPQQLQQRPDAQSTVEVFVQQDFRERAQIVVGGMVHAAERITHAARTAGTTMGRFAARGTAG